MLTGKKYQCWKPEIWGGIECTINRVGNTYKDQLNYSGHYQRPDDIRQFAALGIKSLRYPVLWELHQPSENQVIDWSWAEQQLNGISGNNINPIVGLVHHGSGPSYTSLYDAKFPYQLAAYATQLATKFPWVEYYTPVNEPLTTARFSGLYGLWYPHHKNDFSFARIMVNQVKAIVLAMQSIRKINPAAKLVQTEDLSKTHSTPALAYQAEFENERRWLTYDLLCGLVNKKHSLWNYLLNAGIKAEDLYFFLENPCPSDVMGFNYYVTSERYLDEKIEQYPFHNHGGNGKDLYADTEAVRFGQPCGAGDLLKEAWARYHLPLAVTEVHLNCSREEQMRWFMEIWGHCCELVSQGIDIKAVTAWCLLGAYDWNSLLTRNNNHYESGVFAIRNKVLYKTIMTTMISSLSSTGDYEHPLLEAKGWWHSTDKMGTQRNSIKKAHSPLLIIGKTGTLGNAFERICRQRSIHCLALTRNELDICSETSIREAIEKYGPWAIINTAGYVKMDDAESNEKECFFINATAPGILARVCKECGIKLMTFSSDMVFDGNKNLPYIETDTIRPLNVYGASKAQGENNVLGAFDSALVIRTSAFFGPWDKFNFPHMVLESLQQGGSFRVSNDVIVSPTYIPDLVNASLDLFIDDEKGIWHLCNDGMISWAEFGAEIAVRGGFATTHLEERNSNEMGWKANRPLYSALQNGKGITLPPIDNAIHRFFEESTDRGRGN